MNAVKIVLGILIGFYGLLSFLLSLGGIASTQKQEQEISYNETSFAWWIIWFHFFVYISLLVVLVISKNNNKPYLYTSNMFVFLIGILASIKMVQTHTIILVWRSISSSISVNASAAGFIFMILQDIFVGIIITIFDKYYSVIQNATTHETTQIAFNTYSDSRINNI